MGGALVVEFEVSEEERGEAVAVNFHNTNLT